MPVGFWRLRQNTARSAVGAAAESVLHSHRFDDLVGLGAKMVARDGVEIDAGDADHPGLLRVCGGVDEAGRVGLVYSIAEAKPRLLP
jgi:hypothetical protein